MKIFLDKLDRLTIASFSLVLITLNLKQTRTKGTDLTKQSISKYFIKKKPSKAKLKVSTLIPSTVNKILERVTAYISHGTAVTK